MSLSRFLILVLVFTITIQISAQDPKTAPSGATSTAPAVSVPAFQNSNCPVMGKPASAKLFVDTDYGRIYVCCAACNKKIRQDPAGTHKAAYPKITKLNNDVCPITGEKIEPGSPTVLLQGYEVNLCCKDCIKPAQENAQMVLVKLLKPKVTVVGNKTCPVTGKAVEKNSVVLVGDELVNLSSVKCVDEVQKAPAEMLKKAKESAAKDSQPKEAEKKTPTETKKSGHEGHGHGHD